MPLMPLPLPQLLTEPDISSDSLTCNQLVIVVIFDHKIHGLVHASSTMQIPLLLFLVIADKSIENSFLQLIEFAGMLTASSNFSAR